MRARHYVGTVLYIETRCQQTVKYLLGHTYTSSTDKYVHWSKAFITEPENYIVKVANSESELIELIEKGYEIHTTYNGKPILRKRK